MSTLSLLDPLRNRGAGDFVLCRSARCPRSLSPPQAGRRPARRIMSGYQSSLRNIGILSTPIIYVMYTGIERKCAKSRFRRGCLWKRANYAEFSKLMVKKKRAMLVLLSYAQPRMLDLSPGGG